MAGRRRSAAGASLAALAALALVLPGCAAAAQQGSVTGQAVLSGRVPGGGRPLTVGAVRGGTILATAEIRPTGGRFDLRVRPGRYQVGLWLPGAQQLVPKWMICAAPTNVSVTAGQAAAVTLSCSWH